VRIGYAAGDREVAVEALKVLLDGGIVPVVLMVPQNARNVVDHMCKLVGPEVPVIWSGRRLSEAEMETLMRLRLDYLLSVHYPYVFSEDVLRVARIGGLNLHPAYLPWNRGWHTPSWAIIEGTPMGATLHWMVRDVDAGDIAFQTRVDPEPHDTAHSLYQKVLRAEIRLLADAIPAMKAGTVPRRQTSESGTFHVKKDLEAIRRMDLNKKCRVGDVIDLLRALTTNQPSEAAYFETNGRRYRVRIEIVPEDGEATWSAE